MPDRDTVISRIETICEICRTNKWRTEFDSDTIYPILTDAIALLKEQDAVEPKVIRTNGFGHPVHSCGKCGLLITESMNYCHECGKRIDWEGR